jgi:hypothetical protein
VRRLARWVVPLAVVATIVVSASGAAAALSVRTGRPSGSDGWRISQVMAGVTVGGLWAGSTSDAWLAGDECADQATCGQADGGNGTIVVRHWNGRAWQVVTPPRGYINSPLDQGVAAVAATSGSNAWVLAARGSDDVAYTDALHLVGTGWAAPARLDATIQTAVAPAPTQLWAFGQPSGSGAAGYFAHFVGGTWTHGSFPFNGTASAARSADDVWVAGGGDGIAPLGVEHWNGRRWLATRLPGLGVAAGDLLWANVNGLADNGPDDVWADITFPDDGSAHAPGTIVLHWNGRAWSRVSFPSGDSALSPVASDGDGGIWLAAASSAGDDTTAWFDHYFGGRWSRVRVPTGDGEQPEVFYLTSIPGTSSLWAAGGVNFADDGEAILGYAGGRPLAALRGSRRAGQSGRVRMSETDARGPRARPILVQPQLRKAACAAAAPGGSLTVTRSSARPSRRSPVSSAPMPWRRQEPRTSSWVSAKVRPGCSSVTAAGSGAVRSRHQSVDGRSGIPQA